MKYLIKNKHWEINVDYNKEKSLYLLIDRPDYININNSFIWTRNINHYHNNSYYLHRDYDLPAVICDDHIYWYKNDKRYREDIEKPVTIGPYGHTEYVYKRIVE